VTFAEEARANTWHLKDCRKRGTRVFLAAHSNPLVRPHLEVVYHGTSIVWVLLDRNAVVLHHGGWRTRTTKSRMNHVLGRGTGGRRFGRPPFPTRYSLYQEQSRWYVRDMITNATVEWKGGRYFIISPEYNVGYETDRVPSGWLNS
jgi:hypothetical protein